MIKYRIYPSLLDKFQHLLDSDIEFEAFWNEDKENGGYKTSYEDIVAKNEQELLDAINRVPHEPIEPADKGTCFNEIVDCIKDNCKCTRSDVSIESVPEGEYDGKFLPAHIVAKMHDFVFRFDIMTCKAVAQFFKGASGQVYTEATLTTGKGDVLLYGYADEVMLDKVYDIKTTSSYEFGKYGKGWQRHLYPYCLIASGAMADVSEFEYTPVALTGGNSRNPLITGAQWRECYDYNHHESECALRSVCEVFIDWLEAHREQITDKKIFNEI